MSERIVSHPKYGRGVVKQSRYKGFELYVKFQDGMTRWVRIDEVEEVASPASKPSLTTPTTSPIDEAFKSRRMIEAFRLGIVPHDCVEDFTFGRQDETMRLVDWLNNADDSTLLLVGEYGTGKTHLLQYIYGRALHEGFAVAYVEMDPNEAPFHKPRRVYSRLVQALRYRSNDDQQVKRFRDFLKEALGKGAFKDHEYFKHFLSEYRDKEIFWEWIEGNGASSSHVVEMDDTGFGEIHSLPGMYDYATTANIYCYLLSALGWAARDVLNLKGLVLVFDEAEAVGMNYYSYQAERSVNFLKALIRTADNDHALKEPRHSGLDYCGVGVGPRIPFLYRQPSGLKLLFAFTPIYALGWIRELKAARRIDLQHLTDTALKKVFEHICLLYDSAHEFLEHDLTIDMIFRHVTTQGGRTRMFVKSSVEALDLVRLNHGKPLSEVLQ
jgi:Cdc6-like AAA superfamily ATPase